MTKPPKLYNYEIVKRTLEINQHQFLRINEIAFLCGLSTHQVSRVIKAAWKLGWVERVEIPHHNNSFGKGAFSVLKTRYKLKRTESWSGIMPLYKQQYNCKENLRNG